MTVDTPHDSNHRGLDQTPAKLRRFLAPADVELLEEVRRGFVFGGLSDIGILLIFRITT